MFCIEVCCHRRRVFLFYLMYLYSASRAGVTIAAKTRVLLPPEIRRSAPPAVRNPNSSRRPVYSTRRDILGKLSQQSNTKRVWLVCLAGTAMSSRRLLSFLGSCLLCRHFQRSCPSHRYCPFGKDCFYAHKNEDGTTHEFRHGIEQVSAVRYSLRIVRFMGIDA